MLQAYVKLAVIMAALLIGVSALGLTRPEADGACEGADLREAHNAACSASSTERDEETFHRVSY